MLLYILIFFFPANKEHDQVRNHEKLAQGPFISGTAGRHCPEDTATKWSL